MKEKIYISGAITGLPFEDVINKFSEAEKSLTAQGFEVVSPLKTGIPYNFPWEIHIMIDILLLMGCDAVYLLSDWMHSKGAMLEKSIAEFAGKEIIYENIPVFVELKRAILEVIGVSFYDIVRENRERKNVYARMIYAYFCKETGAKIADIASEMRRNHSTINYYLKKFYDDNMFNSEFREIVRRIKIALSQTETPQISN